MLKVLGRSIFFILPVVLLGYSFNGSFNNSMFCFFNSKCSISSTNTPSPSLSVEEYRKQAIARLSKRNPNVKVAVPTGIYTPITYVKGSSQFTLNDNVNSPTSHSTSKEVVAFVKGDRAESLTVSMLLDLIKTKDDSSDVLHLVIQSGDFQGNEPNTDLMAFKKDIINATVSGSLKFVD